MAPLRHRICLYCLKELGGACGTVQKRAKYHKLCRDIVTVRKKYGWDDKTARDWFLRGYSRSDIRAVVDPCEGVKFQTQKELLKFMESIHQPNKEARGVMNMQLKKKGYNVKGIDDETSVAVVAFTSREAKKLGFVKLDCDWVDIRVHQAKDADVDDLPVGVIDDVILAWRRGIYDWLEDYTETTCDNCHKEMAIERVSRIVFCEKCYNDYQNTRGDRAQDSKDSASHSTSHNERAGNTVATKTVLQDQTKGMGQAIVSACPPPLIIR